MFGKYSFAIGNVNENLEDTYLIVLDLSMKGVFSEPSGEHIVAPNLCFLS